MKQIAILCAIMTAPALPALAQEDEGQSLMEKGVELFFEGLLQEMEPTLGELLGLADELGPAMQSFLQEMGPALAELAAKVEDWSAYEAPEILPNGDIIIRKKPSEDLQKPEEAEPPSGEITDI